MTDDEKFMRAALAEARKGVGKTAPNPAVGAVVVKNGRIVARGWHRAAGQPHAEIQALKALGHRKAPGDALSLYVTLEPCSTHGRTPPCTEAIVKAGIARVVYGATDPNPRHAGKAQKILRAAGLSVTDGVLARECAAVNTAWNKWIATGLPWVIAKAALTLDGRIASPPGRRWITTAASRRDAMKLRAQVQAVLVGGETVRTDDPRLTVRGLRLKPQPLRAVWTKSGKLPRDAKILCDEHKDRTVILKNISLRSALRELGRLSVQSVLIEGGGRTLGEAFDGGLVDEVCFYLAPLLSGGPTAATGARGVGSNRAAIQLSEAAYIRFGDDVRLRGLVVKS